MESKCTLLLLLFALFNFTIDRIDGDILESIFAKDPGVDKNFLTSFTDLLDPRNLIRSVSNVGGDVVRQVAKTLGQSNEIIHLANIRAPEMIQYYKYPVEVHTVQTDDGHIIEIHRIPHGRFGDQNRKRGVVILTPGILCSSACWLFLGPDRALPFILADLGYDVWLGNVRGNTYGRKHVSMNADMNSKFWQFTFHEIGIYDLPAIITYVLRATRVRDLFFVAHSSSTTSFFIMGSERPEFNNVIRAYVPLAPAAYMGHMSNPLLYFLAQFATTWRVIGHLVGMDEFLPNHQFLQRVSGTLCTIQPLSELICANSMFTMCGFNRKQMNDSITPIVFGHTPAGTSLKLLLHYAQLIRNLRERFQYYSYGVTNPLVYKSMFPPAYNLTRVTATTYCIFGRGDWLVKEKDALKTCNELPNIHGVTAVGDPDWSHNDFVYGSGAKEEVYDKIIEIFMKH